MKICLYHSAKDNVAVCREVNWNTLKILLSEFEVREDKDGKAWSPVEIEDGEIRASKNVLAISCAVFDLDKVGEGKDARPLTSEDIVLMAKALENVTYIAHSSFQHTPKNPRLRIVLPLEKPFEKENRKTNQFQAEWETIRKQIVQKYKIPADPSCKDLSRLYYLPTSSNESEGGRICESNEGVELKIADFAGVVSNRRDSEQSKEQNVFQQAVTAIRESQQRASSDVRDLRKETQGGAKQVTEEIDLDKVRLTLNSLNRESSKELIRKVLDGESLAIEGDRDNALLKAASIIAWAIPSLPTEAFLEIIYRSLCAMALEADPNSEEYKIDYWLELAKNKFERAERRFLENKNEELVKLEELKTVFGLRNDTSEPPPLHPRDTNWRDLLQWTNDEIPHLRNTAANLLIMLRYSNEWRGAFRLNLVSKDVEVVRGPIPPNTDPDIIPVMVADWFSIFAKPDEQLRIPINDVQARINVVAWEHKYDPLVTYLDNLKWDKVNRLDQAPFEYFKAHTINDSGEEIKDHVSTVFRRWMIGAVARAYEPGCKMDNVLILESAQGQRKSTALKILGGDWFSDANFVVGDKDGNMIIGRTWICELAEMDNVRNTEPASHRAFFSRRKDTFRAPYGRVIKDWPRRCMFVGSINPDGGGYLKDLTGNRRYWPIAVDSADTIGLVRDRDQLWAETVAIYKATETCESCKQDLDGRCPEHRWWLSRKEEIVAEVQAEHRLEVDDTQAQIEAWWRRTPTAMRPVDGITTSDLAVKLGYPLPQVTRAVQVKVGHALRKLGFKVRRVEYGVRKYIPPERFLSINFDTGIRKVEGALA